MNSQNSKPKPGRPVAPAPYRPQPVPIVLQLKSINQPANKTRVVPVAPQVYRPQPVPVVLQRKVRPELQSRAAQAQQKNPFPPKPVTTQPHKPASAQSLNHIHAKANVAQQKLNSHPGKQPGQPRVMPAYRGIPSRGTVQRSQDSSAVNIKLVFSSIPSDVQQTLNAMVVENPAFKKLCLQVHEQIYPINVFGVPASECKGGKVENKKVIVNQTLDHDDMVNVIVFEITNLLHSKLLGAAKDAETIENIEWNGVIIQSDIMRASKKMNHVKKTPYADKVDHQGWDNFDNYANEQIKRGHTGNYTDRFDDPPKAQNCFLTSACVSALGLPDDCEELTTLRTFRDNYILSLPGGPELVQEYYEVAPEVVKRIYENKESERILGSLYDELVVPSVRLIRNGEYQEALIHYQSWVARLINEFFCS